MSNNRSLWERIIAPCYRRRRHPEPPADNNNYDDTSSADESGERMAAGLIFYEPGPAVVVHHAPPPQPVMVVQGGPPPPPPPMMVVESHPAPMMVGDSPMPVARAPAVWMPPPALIPGCPPGLEFVAMLDTVIVEQLVEMLEVFTGMETANRYVIRNQMGQQIYYAMEMSSHHDRQMAGKFRAFSMRIVNNAMIDVARVNRPEEPCCDYSQGTIEAPPGFAIGFIKGFADGFLICDHTLQMKYRIIAPMDVYCRTQSQCVLAIEGAGARLGALVKHYGGYAKERAPNADTYSLAFPPGITPQMKVVLLVAVFMVDFRYFEDKH